MPPRQSVCSSHAELSVAAQQMASLATDLQELSLKDAASWEQQQPGVMRQLRAIMEQLAPEGDPLHVTMMRAISEKAAPSPAASSRRASASSHASESWILQNFTNHHQTSLVSGDAPEEETEYQPRALEKSRSEIVRDVRGTEKGVEVFEKLHSWDFNVLDYVALPEVQGCQLTALVDIILVERQSMTTACRARLTDPQSSAAFRGKLQNFLRACEGVPMPGPYHNHTHLCDVAQSMNAVFESELMSIITSPFDRFLGVVAGAIHDLGHPGTNNMFHINSHSDLARTYNDTSVLESFHVAKAFDIMNNDPECNWWGMLTDAYTFPSGDVVKPRQRARQVLVQCVVGTDMTKHDKHKNELKAWAASFCEEHDPKDLRSTACIGSPSKANQSPSRRMPLEDGSPASPTRGQIGLTVKGEYLVRSGKDALNLMEWALHACDISNPAKVQPLAVAWAHRVSEEFWAQGDQEKALGLPVSLLCERSGASIPKSQIGFIQFVIQPYYSQICRVFPELQMASDFLDANLEFWKSRAAEEAAAAGEGAA
mmetsp:Transcript_4136/g.9164  ORF Transcript_4136/g.9164 Transcript_4136/m.9164 type:complete len:541 (+) Transcript_4136:45-1667(+)